MESIAAGSLRTAAADLNGQMRGQRLPAGALSRLEYDGQRMALSALSLDLWGRHVDGSPLVFMSGDADGQLRMTDRGPVPIPWLAEPATLIPMSMYTDDGKPFDACPRHALARVLARYAKRGWRIEAGVEIEFSLVSVGSKSLAPATDPLTAVPVHAGGRHDLAELDRFAPFFDDVFAGAEAMGIAARASLSEQGLGQFEISLSHRQAMRTADDVWLLKALVRGLSRKHGLAATFLSKPFADDAGNGLHLHFSVLDEKGRNLFDNGVMTGSALMKQAVAGCIAGMPGATLVFAPHGASYGRLTPRSHAPTGASWGYENRTCALRIPGGDPKARRIEHRAAGADTNPYLVLAGILGAAFMGMEDDLAPPEPIMGDAYGQRILQVPTDWDEAIGRFEASPKMARIFPGQLIDMLTRVKRQEQRKTAAMAPERVALETHQAV